MKRRMKRTKGIRWMVKNLEAIRTQVWTRNQIKWIRTCVQIQIWKHVGIQNKMERNC